MSNDFHPWMKMTKKLSVMIHYDPDSPYLEFHETKEKHSRISFASVFRSIQHGHRREIPWSSDNGFG